jgi:biopolymer transport protein ExbD
MRFKHKSQGSQIPQINLIPLMDILATVLIFFVIISMTLNSEQGKAGIDIELPTTSKGEVSSEDPQVADPLIVGITKKGEILIANQFTNKEELALKIQTYLQEKPEGAVILKADKTLPYEQVIQMLSYMKKIGGDRVSLAIDEK